MLIRDGFHECRDFPDKVVWHHVVGVAGFGDKSGEDGMKELDWRGDSVLSVGVSAVQDWVLATLFCSTIGRLTV